ncbi:RluA family pseudouridine synthase [Pelosinus sp. IPA-1]|uniref:RluA family pseudouridine synthase n=1 Tax=Pelosinus sp. IPA-1 TaxID=3029569 RepID=UPI0024361A4A|nr:RluA family pseudouridine synthase [Pelosinus sp. IPA-1]GMB00192.1 RNA pseudouridine synthase [Pelosinus sp. IPA-1]
MLDLVVPKTVNPMPIKDFLRSHVGLSLTVWRKIKFSGAILVNGKKISITNSIAPGDTITINWVQPCDIIPTKIPLQIVYEDDTLLIIDKPPGMLVHPTTSERLETVGNAVMYYFQQKNLPFKFHPVHRLDRNTSGLLVIAKLPHIQHLLSVNGVKNINRQYVALITGALQPAIGTIDAPIARHPNSIIQRIVSNEGQQATTCYKVLKDLKNASLIELTLLTGRTHQIRVHLSHIGHPILGDDLYGGSRDLISRQALHASSLSFTHPNSGKTIEVSSPLPTDIIKVINILSANKI